jgi:hypothetical protein
MTIGIEESIEQSPHRVPAEPNRENQQQHAAEGLADDDAQSTILIGDPAALIGRSQDCQQSDDGVNRRFRGIA